MGKKTTNSTKPGVMIYFEILPQLEMLKPLQRLAVYEAIMAYGRDRTEPALKREAELVWGFIRPILDRDDERYREAVAARSKGGKSRAAKAKKQKEERSSAEVSSSQLNSAKSSSAQLSATEGSSAQLSSAEASSISQSTISNPQSTISNTQSTISNPQSSNSNPQSTVSSPQSANSNPQASNSNGVRESGSVSGGTVGETAGMDPPSLPQVRKYVLEEGLRFLPEDFVDYYNANGWHVGNQPVRDWKALARRWDRKEKDNAGGAFEGRYTGAYC